MQDRYLRVIAASLAYQAVNSEYLRLAKMADQGILSEATTRTQRHALLDKRADLLTIITGTEL